VDSSKTDFIQMGNEGVNLIYLNTSVFWDITSYSPLKVNRYFGVKYYLHFPGRRISEAVIQCEAGSKREQR
jgi:hypothetical protein